MKQSSVGGGTFYGYDREWDVSAVLMMEDFDWLPLRQGQSVVDSDLHAVMVSAGRHQYTVPAGAVTSVEPVAA